MPELQDYASRDLRRRPFHSLLVLLSITITVAMTTFLFLFGIVLLNVTGLITSYGIAQILTTFFEGFIWVVLILAIGLGVTIVSSTISLELVSRRRDIGLMKSIGAMIDTIYDHFMAQALILLIGGIVLGASVGTVIYLGGMIWLTWALPTLRFTLYFPIVELSLVLLLFLFVGYFVAQRPIYDAVHELPVSAMMPRLSVQTRSVGYLDSLGLSFRIASKATRRRVKGSKRALLALSLSIALASVLWIGGGIVHSTTTSYMTRSMGSNIIAIGHPELLHEYCGALYLTNELLSNISSLIVPQNMIPSQLIADLRDIDGVAAIEERLVEFEQVSEGVAIIWNPTLEQFEIIGDDRTADAFVVGLDWTNTLSDWYFEGRAPGEYDVLIGSTLATTMFTDPLIQTLEVRGTRFNVSAIAFEVLNGGVVTFMSLSVMRTLYDVNGSNLVLVQLKSYDDVIISSIISLVESYGLGLYLLQDVLEENLRTLEGIWYLLQPLPIMALVSAFISLMSYMLTSVSARLRDYIIMRCIGGRPSFIAKTMFAEGLNMIFSAGLPGIILATLLSVYLLVPEAAISSIMFLPVSVLSMLIALVIVAVFATIPVYLLFSSKSDLRVSEFGA